MMMRQATAASKDLLSAPDVLRILGHHEAAQLRARWLYFYKDWSTPACKMRGFVD